MQDIYFILSKLPVVIEILFMLSRFVYPSNGKQLLDIERDIYRLTAKIGDQFVLRMLEKVHQDPEFVAKAVQRARSERQVPVKNKGYRLVNVLLLGGSKVVLNTPYFLDNHGLKTRDEGRKGGAKADEAFILSLKPWAFRTESARLLEVKSPYIPFKPRATKKR